jgi:hypothetical protein
MRTALEMLGIVVIVFATVAFVDWVLGMPL